MTTIKLTIGEFTYDMETKTLEGPAVYLRERGEEKMRQMLAGNDEGFNAMLLLAPSEVTPEALVLTALQTDLAGWLGMKQIHLLMEKGHGESVTGLIEEVRESGQYNDWKKLNEQFFTPIELVDDMVEWAHIERDDICLEPSAGDGRIVRAMSWYSHHVEWVEKDPRFEASLQRTGSLGSTMDFLEVGHKRLRPTAIVMNPPFSKLQDCDHVYHAYSLLANNGLGRLISVMSPSWTFRSSRKADDFRAFVAEIGAEWEMLPENTFRQSGTTVRAGLLKVRKLTP